MLAMVPKTCNHHICSHAVLLSRPKNAHQTIMRTLADVRPSNMRSRVEAPSQLPRQSASNARVSMIQAGFGQYTRNYMGVGYVWQFCRPQNYSRHPFGAALKSRTLNTKSYQIGFYASFCWELQLPTVLMNDRVTLQQTMYYMSMVLVESGG